MGEGRFHGLAVTGAPSRRLAEPCC